MLTDLSVRRLMPAEKNLDVTDMEQLDSKGVHRQGFFLRINRFPRSTGWLRAFFLSSFGQFPSCHSRTISERLLCRNRNGPSQRTTKHGKLLPYTGG